MTLMVKVSFGSAIGGELRDPAELRFVSHPLPAHRDDAYALGVLSFLGASVRRGASVEPGEVAVDFGGSEFDHHDMVTRESALSLVLQAIYADGEPIVASWEELPLWVRVLSTIDNIGPFAAAKEYGIEPDLMRAISYSPAERLDDPDLMRDAGGRIVAEIVQAKREKNEAAKLRPIIVSVDGRSIPCVDCFEVEAPQRLFKHLGQCIALHPSRDGGIQLTALNGCEYCFAKDDFPSARFVHANGFTAVFPPEVVTTISKGTTMDIFNNTIVSGFVRETNRHREKARKAQSELSAALCGTEHWARLAREAYRKLVDVHGVEKAQVEALRQVGVDVYTMPAQLRENDFLDFLAWVESVKGTRLYWGDGGDEPPEYEWDRDRFRVVSTAELTDSLYVTMMDGPVGPFAVYNWHHASHKWHTVPLCADWSEVDRR